MQMMKMHVHDAQIIGQVMILGDLLIVLILAIKTISFFFKKIVLILAILTITVFIL